MLDHIVLNVADIALARAFYEPTLAALGLRVVKEFPGGVGFGDAEGKPIFWLGVREPVCLGVHIALRCSDHATVDAFHAAAMTAGGTDHGAPGPREMYHPHYYGGFVLDPAGNNIEAVCHEPQT